MQIEQINSYEFDERFYVRIVDGIRVYQPSVTHILHCVYPMDFGLIQWRGDVGNKRADEILEETSEDGVFVHDSIEKILKGLEISGELISQRFSPKRSLKIKRCLKSFLDWAEEHKPTIILTESTVWSDEHKCAGTVDLICEIRKEKYLIDFKTSKTLHDSHKAQVCAYGLAAHPTVDHVALLHLGNTTKKRYSFKILDEDERVRFTKIFHDANRLFQTIYTDAHPNSETFPEIFSLKKEEASNESNIKIANG